jgi:mannose-6-phosphate isomerase-like protein (cupin superfamily)
VADDATIEDVTFMAMPGMVMRNVWSSSSPPTVPFAGRLDLSGPYFHSPGGVRIVQWDFPPSSSTAAGEEVDSGAAAADMEEKIPGVVQHMEPDEPGMHASDTVDVGIVNSGQITLELDDGKEVQLNEGDTFIQNGTRHRWKNNTNEIATVTFVMVGATRSS